MNWSSGYVTDIEYVYDYQAEFNWLRQRLMCLTSGVAISEPKTACELGFGQGLSVNIHAAASSIEWWGTDFNPTQAQFACQMADVTGSGARLFDQAFADFCYRPDLPDFDMIGLHGIWSWISDENRRVIVDFIERRLKSGGLLYISYNTLPGWGPFAPVRQLLKHYDSLMSAPEQDAAYRMDAAMRFVGRLLDTEPLFLRASPQIKDNLEDLQKYDRRYLVHEYLNSDWDPMHVADMAKWLEPTKCEFVCPANYIKSIDELNLSTAQQEFLREILDPVLRESVRDFAVNERFRRDYWVKGPRRLSPQEQAERVRAERVILGASRASIPRFIAGARAKVAAPFFGPILDVLKDHRPRSLGEIERAVQDSGLPFAETIRAIMILAGAGFLQPVQDEEAAGEATNRTDKLNNFLIERARFGTEVGRLASPVTGGGVRVPWIVQLFLLAGRNGRETPRDQAAFVWSVLQEQGQRAKRDGKDIETAEDSLAELTKQAEIVAQQHIPVLSALGITRKAV
jgi:SAM-dependent methyltransferase